MKREIWTASAVAGAEGRQDSYVAQEVTPSSHEANPAADIDSLLQKIADASIVEIDRLIGEFQRIRNFLESEGERIQNETTHFVEFNQMASASVKIISATVQEWRQAGHPTRNGSRSSIYEIVPEHTESDLNGDVHPEADAHTSSAS